MKTIRFATMSFWLGFMTCLLGLNSLICAEEPPTIIYELDFNDCDSVKLQGAVMSVNPGNMTITVAEKEIRLMDVASNDQRLKTVLMNIDGKPEKMESFKVGQVVQVEGFEHPDGFVAASKIQKISTIQQSGKGSKNRLQQTKAKP
jgi:hypothetical protein